MGRRSCLPPTLPPAFRYGTERVRLADHACPFSSWPQSFVAQLAIGSFRNGLKFDEAL
jgi:hypothetical protein